MHPYLFYLHLKHSELHLVMSTSQGARAVQTILRKPGFQSRLLLAKLEFQSKFQPQQTQWSLGGKSTKSQPKSAALALLCHPQPQGWPWDPAGPQFWPALQHSQNCRVKSPRLHSNKVLQCFYYKSSYYGEFFFSWVDFLCTTQLCIEEEHWINTHHVQIISFTGGLCKNQCVPHFVCSSVKFPLKWPLSSQLPLHGDPIKNNFHSHCFLM